VVDKCIEIEFRMFILAAGLGEVVLSFPTAELILNYRLARPPWSSE